MPKKATAPSPRLLFSLTATSLENLLTGRRLLVFRPSSLGAGLFPPSPLLSSSANTMEKPDVLNFKVGQLAEMRTFEEGFRGAWFRCKIINLCLEEDKILPEYYDFPDEEVAWAEIYDLPNYGRKTKQMKKQLMFRPHYPPMYHKSEMPLVDSISEVCVTIDGTWKVGDLVDWYKDGCYWCARVIKVLSDDKVEVELPMPPAGEGKGEEGTHEAFCKDLRPSLDWSAGIGWTLATMEGESSSSAQLLFPSEQGMDSEEEVKNASSTSRVSAMSSVELKMEEDVVVTSSSDSISTLHNNVKDEGGDGIGYKDLNIYHEDTIEAAIVDLEELVNKVRWMRRIVEEDKLDTGYSYSFMNQ